MSLNKAAVGQRLTVKEIMSKPKIVKFLLSLGCYEGEEITVISKLAGNYVINIRDSRYAIDEHMAKTIKVAYA